jgi:hypothetical protein
MITTWGMMPQDRIHSPLGINMIESSSIYATSPSHSPGNKQNTQPTHAISSQSSTSTSHSTQQHPKYSTGIQTTVTPNKTNHPFGNLITGAKPPNSVRILFQNVNGIQKARSWNELSSFSQKIKDLEVDIVGAAETNLKWNFKRNQQAKAILQKHHKTTSVTTSSNKEECFSAYQPGGTLTSILNKYVGRIQTAIHDPTSLGRWSGFKLNTNFGHYLNIITVYQPTKSDGLHTTYQQHSHFYRLQGITNPDPRKLLLQDLEAMIREFNKQKEETIVLIDANDGLHQRHSLLPTFLSNTNLVSLIPNTANHPATHSRGSHCIDFILGSNRLLDHIHAAGISAFYDDPWPNSDHRSLFIDIDELGLFGATLETIPPPIKRILTSKSKKSIEKFIAQLERSNKIDNLLDSLHKLSQISVWGTQQHDEIERIDQMFTNELLQAESKCATPVDFAWSPTIQQKSVIYQYWLTTIHGIQNKIDISAQLRALQDQLQPNEMYQGNHNRPILKQLKHARKQLINARLRADELREEYLELLQEIAINEGNMTKADAVRQLANKERQIRCWRTFKLLRQGKHTQGGLTHVLVPETVNGIEILHRVYEKTKVDHTLLQRNISHFSQADKTPFTTSPLLEIIGEDGCTNAALEILEGRIPKGIPKFPTMILQKLKRVRDQIPICFTIEDMCTGFSKWREKTTTSPSSKHLGIYRALIAADKHLHNSKEQQHSQTTTTSTARKCLQIQHLLMTLAIAQCHTYQRWTVVHNFLIEKTPGLPRIDKLRVIHLYEADWSLIQKFFVAHKINKIASTNKTVPIEQAGGRPGRSAIELAANRMLTFETIRLQRLSGAVVYNDAKACYDRVIENISNLALLKQGLPIEIARLHAQTFHQIQYFIKHKLGIGQTPHSHKHPQPVYGVGQGSTDAPARWGFTCDPLLELYKELASDATIQSPISNTKTNNKIAGFVDDTTTLTIQHYTIMIYIILILQKDAQLWERLLYTSGGKLEIPKCIFALFDWSFDKWGRPTLSSSSSNHLHLQCSETKKHAIIPQMSTKEAYKYVGIQLALDGNMEAQILDLQKKCNDMSTILSQTYFSAREADLGFTTVFTPSVKYALPVSSISPVKLLKIQQAPVTAVLPRLGYNKHMPRAVVFATKSRGGIGLLNLPTEQGASQLQLLLTHIRAKSNLHDTIIILIETYQLITGTSKSPFVDTSPRSYVSSPWIQSVQSFLSSINGTIYIPSITPITKNRVNDQLIMDLTTNTFTKSELECINACRIFLQVNYLSEISNDAGSEILPEAVKGATDKHGQPLIWRISKSKMTWPRQPRPPPHSWNQWKKFLQSRTSPTLKIQPVLGDWIPSAYTQRTWHYRSHQNIVFTTNDTPEVFVQISTRTRSRTYIRSNTSPNELQSILYPPVIPHHITEDRITCYGTPQKIAEIISKDTHPPSITYQVKNLAQTPTTTVSDLTPSHTINIKYEVSSSSQLSRTYALITCNDVKVATTSFQIPDHRHTTVLTSHAFGCLVPILWCSTELPGQPADYNIHLRCNSKQIHSQLHRVKSTLNCPTQCYAPEWDLLYTTSQLLQRFRSHKLTLRPEKSDTNDTTSLELRSQPNQEATQIQWSIKTSSYEVAQLLIHNQRVPSEYTPAIREAHTAPAIDEYYTNKYGWNHKTVNSIMWKQHGKALIGLPKRMSKTITQFNHDWLPVNASHSINAVGTGRLCPFCTTCDEDQHHFLCCTHPHITKLWNEAAVVIKSKVTAYDKNIHHHLIQLLSLSVSTWRTTSKPTLPPFLHPQFHNLFYAQSNIGWDHMLRGRFSKRWRHHLYQERERTMQWITFSIRTIWYEVYSIWKTRCNIHHGLSNDEKTKRSLLYLTPKVQALYQQQNDLHNYTDTHMFDSTIEEVLTRPIPTIKAWVQKVTLRIKTAKDNAKAKRRREKAKFTQIHPFFTLSSKHKVTTIRPRQHLCSMHPKLTSTTLTAFFPQIRKKQSPMIQNDLYPP